MYINEAIEEATNMVVITANRLGYQDNFPSPKRRMEERSIVTGEGKFTLNIGFNAG